MTFDEWFNEIIQCPQEQCCLCDADRKIAQLIWNAAYAEGLKGWRIGQAQWDEEAQKKTLEALRRDKQ